MKSPESIQQLTDVALPALRRAVRTPLGRVATTLMLTLFPAVAAEACSNQDTNTLHSTSVQVTHFDGRDLRCMGQDDSYGFRILDCDWRSYYASPNKTWAGLSHMNLSEHDEPYGNGKVRCLRYPLSYGFEGETCDWADPAIQNETPTTSQPERVIVYKGHDKDCITEVPAYGFTEYSCNLDERSDYVAPSTESRIPATELSEHNDIPWDGGTVTGLEYPQDRGFVGATIDWATVK